MTIDQNLHIILLRMLECATQIETYIKGMTEDKFSKDRKTQDVCIMQLQVIWELCSNIKKHFPEFDAIPYQKIIGLRNIIAHDYFWVDEFEIRIIINKRIPSLKKEIIDYVGKNNK